MNLVVGATGLLGGEVCRLLVAAGKTVRALVRPTSDQTRVAQLKDQKIEIVQGDLKNLSSLEAVCQGVTAVITTASSTHSRQEGDSIESVDLNGQLNLINAAKEAGVNHFVLISFPPFHLDFPLQTAKRGVEDHLRQSGLKYTILQPTCFMEVWLSPALGFDFANAKAQIYGAGENKLSWISYRDVAEFAVAALENAAATNAVIELGGPEPLSPLEVVKIFEESQGRPFVVQHLPEEELIEQKKNAVDPLLESFAALMLYYAAGNVIEMSNTLERFPLQLTSVKDYARVVS